MSIIILRKSLQFLKSITTWKWLLIRKGKDGYPTWGFKLSFLCQIHRRKTQGKQSAERRELIKNTYKPLHKDIYQLQTSHLHPEFIKIVEYASNSASTVEGLMKLITPCDGERVFSFPVFTDEFCVKFMEEVLYLSYILFLYVCMSVCLSSFFSATAEPFALKFAMVFRNSAGKILSKFSVRWLHNFRVMAQLRGFRGPGNHKKVKIDATIQWHP